MFVPFLLENLQDDSDIKNYLDYLAVKQHPPVGDASKRGLSVYGSAFCSCSKAPEVKTKQVLIFVCQECNDQGLWNHLTRTAVNLTKEVLRNLATQRQGWRTRAKIAIARHSGRIVPKTTSQPLVLQSPERVTAHGSVGASPQMDLSPFGISHTPSYDELMRMIPSPSTDFELYNLSPSSK